MRLPWLQIDADGMTRGRLLGRLLGMNEHHGVGLALALWQWALEMSPEGDFSGDVPGDPEMLAAALSWPIGDATRLIACLQRVGLITVIPMLRVRGLNRYRRAWEKNQRRAPTLDCSFSKSLSDGSTATTNGKPLDAPRNNAKLLTSGDRVPVTGDMSAGTGAEPAGTGAEPARKTETETYKKETRVADKPRHPRESDCIGEDFKAIIGAEYLWQKAKDGVAWAALRKHSSVEEIRDRWRRGLAAHGWLKVASVAQLASKWNDLAAAKSNTHSESLSL